MSRPAWLRRIVPWFGGLGRDLRHVARGLRRSPGFTALVVSVLALGIGAATAVFSLVHGVLLAPLPFSDPQQLVTVQVHVRELEDRYPAFPANLRALEAWADCRDACADIAAISPAKSVLENEGGPRSLQSARVTANFFDLLGAAPAVGRTLQAADMAVGGPGAAVLTHGLWQGAFGGDPDVVGRMLLLDDERVEVVGVLPESFWLPDLDRLTPLPGLGGGAVDIFRPLRYTPEAARRFGEFDHVAIARLAPGISAEQAVPELTALTRDAFQDAAFTVTPIVRPLDLQIVSDVRPALRWLLAAVAVTLLAACVNVAGLLSARGLRRRREMAVRSALGGGSADLVRHALIESGLLAGLGGLAGLGVAHASLRLAVAAAPVEAPRLGEAAVDGLALALTAAVVGVCAIGCGLPQAWRASRTAPAAVLKVDARAGGDRSSRRFGDLLVGAQVALTVLLLVAGGLLLASFVRVMQVDRGFDPASVVAVDLHLPARYDAERRTRFQDELLARLAGAPVVASAGVTQRLPLEGEAFVESVVPADGAPLDPAELIALQGNYRFVNPDYFQTLGMVMTRGRPFGEQDRTRPVAVVTEQTAARLWPGQDPVGRRFRRGSAPGRLAQEVVGVVGDARILGLDVDPGLVVYLPYWELARPEVTVVARGPADAGTIVAAVREAARGIDPRLPAANARVLDDVLAASVAVRRFLLQVTGGFAGAGLVLVGLGVFGAVSQRTVRRRREFAVRLTLGATRRRVVGHVCAQALRPVVGGLAVGLLGSLAAVRFVETLLFGVALLDPVVLGGASLAVLALAAGACLTPAVRALRVPLARTLQAE